MFCSNCGAKVSDSLSKCVSCGWSESTEQKLPNQNSQATPVSPQPTFTAKDIGDDPVYRIILPVGRSLWAIAAGYLGLVSVLLLPAPFALITGIIAIIDIKKNPSRHGLGRAIFGIVMGALFSLFLVLGLTSMFL